MIFYNKQKNIFSSIAILEERSRNPIFTLSYEMLSRSLLDYYYRPINGAFSTNNRHNKI